MTRKTKLQKLHDSHNEDLQKFGTEYLEYKDFQEKNFSDLHNLKKIDVVIENVQYMQKVISFATHTIVSAINYIESLEKEIGIVSKNVNVRKKKRSIKK